jgi:iron complex transport system substrate-binding protein
VAADIEAALARSTAPDGSSPISALVFQSNGFFAGQGVLIDELLGRTGFVNVAARYQLGQFGIVSLERVVADPPQALLAGAVESGGLTWADRVVSHPALKSSAGRMARAELPERLLLCGGPVIPQTLAVLANARRKIAGQVP